MFPESKVTEIYCMADDFCKEFTLAYPLWILHILCWIRGDFYSFVFILSSMAFGSDHGHTAINCFIADDTGQFSFNIFLPVRLWPLYPGFHNRQRIFYLSFSMPVYSFLSAYCTDIQNQKKNLLSSVFLVYRFYLWYCGTFISFWIRYHRPDLVYFPTPASGLFLCPSSLCDLAHDCRFYGSSAAH